MPSYQVLARGPLETRKVAGILAEELLGTKRKNKEGALVVALLGELGAGKTTFAQGFGTGLGVKKPITSPTFTILKSYELQAVNYKLLVHIDAYRLESEKDLLVLDWNKYARDPENIILIEWVSNVEGVLPKEYVKVEIGDTAEGERKIKIT